MIWLCNFTLCEIIEEGILESALFYRVGHCGCGSILLPDGGCKSAREWYEAHAADW